MDARTALMQTKAGRRFVGFMKAMNSGDPAIIADFVQQYTADEALQQQPAPVWNDELGRIYAVTGGLRVMQVMAADEYKVLVLMQAHSNGTLYLSEMTVAEEYPHKIVEFVNKPA